MGRGRQVTLRHPRCLAARATWGPRVATCGSRRLRPGDRGDPASQLPSQQLRHGPSPTVARRPLRIPEHRPGPATMRTDATGGDDVRRVVAPLQSSGRGFESHHRLSFTLVRGCVSFPGASINLGHPDNGGPEVRWIAVIVGHQPQLRPHRPRVGRVCCPTRRQARCTAAARLDRGIGGAALGRKA